ncbi:MAG: hypothetical protein OXG79_12380 [Chloroflexi bacterium]|nr:hypothetical protein [Chloroflexota bacterium]
MTLQRELWAREIEKTPHRDTVEEALMQDHMLWRFELVWRRRLAPYAESTDQLKLMMSNLYVACLIRYRSGSAPPLEPFTLRGIDSLDAQRLVDASAALPEATIKHFAEQLKVKFQQEKTPKERAPLRALGKIDHERVQFEALSPQKVEVYEYGRLHTALQKPAPPTPVPDTDSDDDDEETQVGDTTPPALPVSLTLSEANIRQREFAIAKAPTAPNTAAAALKITNELTGRPLIVRQVLAKDSTATPVVHRLLKDKSVTLKAKDLRGSSWTLAIDV